MQFMRAPAGLAAWYSHETCSATSLADLNPARDRQGGHRVEVARAKCPSDSRGVRSRRRIPPLPPKRRVPRKELHFWGEIIHFLDRFGPEPLLSRSVLSSITVFCRRPDRNAVHQPPPRWGRSLLARKMKVNPIIDIWMVWISRSARSITADAVGGSARVRSVFRGGSIFPAPPIAGLAPPGPASRSTTGPAEASGRAEISTDSRARAARRGNSASISAREAVEVPAEWGELRPREETVDVDLELRPEIHLPVGDRRRDELDRTPACCASRPGRWRRALRQVVGVVGAEDRRAAREVSPPARPRRSRARAVGRDARHRSGEAGWRRALVTGRLVDHHRVRRRVELQGEGLSTSPRLI